YGAGAVMNNLGHAYGTMPANESQVGFGLSGQQKASLVPALQQLRGIFGENPQVPFHMNASGGIGQALQALGVTGVPQAGYGLDAGQQQSLMASLQQLVNGINRGMGGSPTKYSPGHRGGGIQPPVAYPISGPPMVR